MLLLLAVFGCKTDCEDISAEGCLPMDFCCIAGGDGAEDDCGYIVDSPAGEERFACVSEDDCDGAHLDAIDLACAVPDFGGQ
jgi:hypothetical protein